MDSIMESVIVKQEEDWTYTFDGTEADLDIKTELDQNVDLQDAWESTVPTLLNDSQKIKQEPTDSVEEAVTSQENSALCTSPHYVCDATIVKVEGPTTEAAVEENDVWLQRLAGAQLKQELSQESVQHDVKVECDEVEETPVADKITERKHTIPVIVGSRKFVVVPRSTRNALAAAANTHEEQASSQVPAIAKLIMKVLEDNNSKIKSNVAYSIAKAPVAENVTTTLKPVLRISNKPISKIFSTAEPCLQPKHIPPQKIGRYIFKQNRRIPDCIFQPTTKNMTSDITKTSLKRAMDNVVQRAVINNRILDHSVAKSFMTPLIMTKKSKPLNTKECLNLPIVNSPLVRSSCNISPLVRNSSNTSPLVRNSSNTSPLVRNSSNTSPLVRNSSNTSPLVKNSYNTSPLVRNSSNTSPLVRNSSNTSPLVRNSSNTSLLVRNSSNTSPLVRNSSNTLPLVRNSSNTSPLVRNSSNTSPLVRNSSNTSPLVRNSYNTSPLVRNSSNTSPLVRNSSNTSPLVRNSSNTSPLVKNSSNTSPLVRNSYNTSPLVRISYNNSPFVRNNYSNSPEEIKDSTQAKEPRLTKQSQKLLDILETLKASKRAEAFKKVTRAQAATIRKSAVANVKPMPQKTIERDQTSMKTKISQILTYINSWLPQSIEAKATLKPIRLKSSIQTSQLEAMMMPCYVKIDRLKLLTCAVCRQQFYLKSQFVEHVFQHVRTPSIMPNVPCNICGKYYQRKYIKIHERKEHGPKKFWCDHCGKKYSDKGSLINHLITHSDTKLYRCEVCNKRFRRKSNLLSHQQMHSSDKPYSCIICDKQFRRKTSLSKHSLYHLAVRPHQCKICDKQFCQLFHLERHFLVHTGERPFACEICNMRFTRSSHRKRHMAKHMSEKNYACEVCEKPFKERRRLEKHKRVHEVLW